jgi:hypothetical protein
MTAETERRLSALLEDVVEEAPPGPFGRWLTEAFNERPWLNEGGRDPNERY